MNPAWIRPDWPAPPNVHAVSTTRAGGVSAGPYASMNLGLHVGDSPDAVLENRARLCAGLPAEPLWLDQVHGVEVRDAGCERGPVRGDAAVAMRPDAVCGVMTADCLPVLLCDDAGSVVAAAHAGWRGLAAGVLEATVARMEVPPSVLIAWLGPAIGPRAFEVGEEVRRQFVDQEASAGRAFRAGRDGKWMADLFMLASARLERLGVTRVFGGTLCTYSDPQRFFSYRRDGTTGRMMSVVWIGKPLTA